VKALKGVRGLREARESSNARSKDILVLLFFLQIVCYDVVRDGFCFYGIATECDTFDCALDGEICFIPFTSIVWCNTTHIAIIIDYVDWFFLECTDGRRWITRRFTRWLSSLLRKTLLSVTI
jgi:hypothetical protein